jgi:hypothetical protein
MQRKIMPKKMFVNEGKTHRVYAQNIVVKRRKTERDYAKNYCE